MATDNKGIIAGIGDMANGINIIYPAFDARIYNFIIGKNGFISGFTIDSNNANISAGMCIAQGYRGYTDKNYSIPNNAQYIYGKFIVHHDKDIQDEFYLVFSTAKVAKTDDILHSAGEYWLPLYQKSGTTWMTVSNSSLYPLRATYSTETKNVASGGFLANGVTATTQVVNDRTRNVATTEFVQKQIEVDINAKSDSAPITYQNGETGVVLNFAKKSKQVVVTVSMNTTIPGSAIYAGLTFAFPNGFVPTAPISMDVLVKTNDNSVGKKWTFYAGSGATTASAVKTVDYAKPSNITIEQLFSSQSFGYLTNS